MLAPPRSLADVTHRLVEIRCIGLWAGVQFAPPLTIKENDVDLLISVLDAAVKECAGA